jgi:hypothetical protein
MTPHRPHGIVDVEIPIDHILTDPSDTGRTLADYQRTTSRGHTPSNQIPAPANRTVVDRLKEKAFIGFNKGNPMKYFTASSQSPR